MEAQLKHPLGLCEVHPKHGNGSQLVGWQQDAQGTVIERKEGQENPFHCHFPLQKLNAFLLVISSRHLLLLAQKSSLLAGSC